MALILKQLRAYSQGAPLDASGARTPRGQGLATSAVGRGVPAASAGSTG